MSSTDPRAPTRLLLIEDDDLDSLFVRKCLRRAGLDVELVVAGSLREARKYLEGTPFDCVLLDHRLPDGDGASLAREVDAPIVLLSGHTRYEVARDLDCVHAFLCKADLSPDRLKQAIEAARNRYPERGA